MNGSFILAHPHPGSFNHAIAETVIRALEENRHIICSTTCIRSASIQYCPMMEFDRMFSCPRSSLNTALKSAIADGTVFVHHDWRECLPRY